MVRTGDSHPTTKAWVYFGGILVESNGAKELVLVKFEEFEKGLLNLNVVSLSPGEERKVYNKMAWGLA